MADSIFSNPKTQYEEFINLHCVINNDLGHQERFKSGQTEWSLMKKSNTNIEEVIIAIA